MGKKRCILLSLALLACQHVGPADMETGTETEEVPRDSESALPTDPVDDTGTGQALWGTDPVADTETGSLLDTGEDTDTCPYPIVQMDELPYPGLLSKVEEICVGPDVHWECYLETAYRQGAGCVPSYGPTEDICTAGRGCSPDGLCYCDNGCQCGQGVCTTMGVCAPLLCLGYWRCSGWGGCDWWTGDPEESLVDDAASEGKSCCETHEYPAFAYYTTNQGPDRCGDHLWVRE